VRKYTWQIAGATVNIALDIALAKGWADKVPNLLVFCLFLLSLAPILYWLGTHEKLLRHRQYLRQRFIHSRAKFLLAASLLLIPVVTSSVIGTVWVYRKVSRFVSQPAVAQTTTGTPKTSTPNTSVALTYSDSEHKQVVKQPGHKPAPREHATEQENDKAVTNTAQPQGVAGVVGDNAVVEMSGSSQITGYQTGVLGDHAHVVMKDQSRIEKNPTPPPSAPVYQQYYWGNPSGPVLSNIGIKSPPTDLPLNPVPAGTSSTSSTKDQTDIITALVKAWRGSHPNWTVIGRNSIKWMNQRLEEQGKDFRIQMPEHCNPPFPGLVGINVPSGTTATLEGVGINGAMVGVEVGQNSTVHMNNTEVVVEDKCD
jgi:hypothetical protein